MDPAECPKCGTSRERALPTQACPSCGLRLDRWGDFSTPTLIPHELLDPAFAQLAETWDDPKAHDRFISLARTADALQGAAARYRQRLRASPDEQAQRSLTQIALLAVQDTAQAGRDRPRLGPVFAALWVISIVSLIAIAVVAYKVVAGGHAGR